MIKVVPYTYGLDEEMREHPEINLVGIEEISITYMQEPDTNSTSDEYQHITITTRQACAPSKEDAEKEESYYFDISIPEGEHWSVNDGNELKTLVDDFISRIYVKDENNN
jgi:hypothetical protein